MPPMGRVLRSGSVGTRKPADKAESQGVEKWTELD